MCGQSADQIKVSGSFIDQPRRYILNKISENAGIRIYFKEDSILTQPISFSARDMSLKDALLNILKDTGWGYLIYRDYAVVIGPQFRLNQSYNPLYYSKLEEIISSIPGEEQLVIGNKDHLDPMGSAVITGSLVDDLSAEPLMGAVVYLSDSSGSTVTDQFGKFTIQSPTGIQTLTIQSLGYIKKDFPLMVYSDDHLELNLSKDVVNLDEVTIEAEAGDVNVESTQIGIAKLDLKDMQKIPVLMGEIDIERILLLQPGVSKIADGSSGFNVRGGEVDQNLILQDEGLLMNTSHALGFVSTFNADLIQSVSLYKGSMPAQYGGRLSSVLDVQMRNGNFQNLSLKAGISPVSSKLKLEFPLVKEKSSLNVGFRSTYADALLKLARSPDVRNSSAFFYDGQMRYAHKLNDRNNLEVSFYTSQDNFRFSDQFGFDYKTLLGQVALKSQIREKFFSQLSISASQYESSRKELRTNQASQLDNGVSYLKLKELVTYTYSDQVKLEGGISSIYYQVDPGSIMPTNTISVVSSKALEKEQALESALFLQSEWAHSPAFSVNAGVRMVLYHYLGPKTMFRYLEGQPVTLENLQDTLSFSSGTVIESYTSVEPRLSFRYRLNLSESIKAGYSRTAQFINQISNFDAPTPSSVWQLSNTHLQPLRAHNYSLGFFKNLNDNNWETSIEAYYRSISNQFDYKDFAEINVNEHLETELVTGRGRAYGLELSVKKQQGNFNGWLSYTLSRTERQIEGINHGNWYLSNLDKTHDVSLVGIFQIDERQTFTINFNYATGRPTTAPVGTYRNENGLIIPVYSQRNQLRIPDFHRLDIGYTVGQGYNRSRRVKTSWSFSVYNLYGRRNAYSVYFIQKPFDFPTANRFSVLGSIMPSISFNIEFK